MQSLHIMTYYCGLSCMTQVNNTPSKEAFFLLNQTELHLDFLKRNEVGRYVTTCLDKHKYSKCWAPFFSQIEPRTSKLHPPIFTALVLLFLTWKAVNTYICHHKAWIWVLKFCRFVHYWRLWRLSTLPIHFLLHLSWSWAFPSHPTSSTTQQ